MMKNRLGVNRVGFTATKKVGKACARNRARRVMREAYRQLLDEISARGLRPVGCSYKEGLWDEIAQRDPAQYRTKISVAVE